MRTISWLMCVIFLVCTAASAADLVIAPVDFQAGDQIDTGAGCYFDVAGVPNKSILVHTEEVWMNINGKNRQLQLDSEKRGPYKIASKSVRQYSGEDVNVELKFEQTSECKEGQECAGESYKGVLTVKSGKRTKTIKVNGGCGC